MNQLKVSFLQTELEWENPVKNRSQFEEKILALDSTDLILLPEMFSTGFSMKSVKLAEKMDGESVLWMQKMAKKSKAVVCGTLIIEEAGHYYNRLIWMRADGSFETYDKRHLFRMADEDQSFSAGQEKLTVVLKGWKICPLICYDLRFPVWSRNTYKTDRKTFADAEYDLLIYVANWPAARSEAWRKLLLARAIENQVFVAGLNRIGKDGKGIEYLGASAMIDSKGDRIWEAENNQSEVKTITIELDELKAFREKFPLGMDADDFKLL